MAISFNNASSGDGSGSSLTFEHVVNAGSNKILLVGINQEDASGGGATCDPISGITYDAVALTQIDTQLYDSANNRADLWYLLNPNEGTANVVATLGEAVDGVAGGAITVDGAKQQAPEVDAKDTGAGTTASVAITTQTNNAWVIDCVGNSSSSTDMEAAAGQTERYEDSADQRINGSTKPVVSAGATSMSWELAVSKEWGIIAASFEEEAAAPPTGGFMTTNPFYWGA